MCGGFIHPRSSRSRDSGPLVSFSSDQDSHYTDTHLYILSVTLTLPLIINNIHHHRCRETLGQWCGLNVLTEKHRQLSNCCWCTMCSSTVCHQTGVLQVFFFSSEEVTSPCVRIDYVVLFILPKDKDDVNRRDVCECDGWVCVLEVMDTPSKLSVIRKAAVLTRVRPTLTTSRERLLRNHWDLNWVFGILWVFRVYYTWVRFSFP